MFGSAPTYITTQRLKTKKWVVERKTVWNALPPSFNNSNILIITVFTISKPAHETAKSHGKILTFSLLVVARVHSLNYFFIVFWNIRDLALGVLRQRRFRPIFVPGCACRTLSSPWMRNAERSSWIFTQAPLSAHSHRFQTKIDLLLERPPK